MKRTWQLDPCRLCAPGRPNLIRLMCLVLLIVGTVSKAFSQRGIITTYAGGGPNSPVALSAEIINPESVAVDASENIYIAAAAMNQVFRVDRSGNLNLVAGTGVPGFSGDGGPATRANLNWPVGVAVDAHGNLFIADNGNARIRRVDAATGIITTVAGDGTQGFSGDGGPATSASFSLPYGVVVDALGNLFIPDTYNNRVRRVDAASGIITTVAGDGTEGFSGDGGPATSGSLNWPFGIALDANGNLFIADTSNNRIRRVDAVTGIITTVAGGGNPGFGGDGGLATSASLLLPSGAAVDNHGNLFIADTGNERICRVDAVTGDISTVAGDGDLGYSGDGGPAGSASLYYPHSVAVDSSGNLFIADSANNRIREVASGIITTAAGGGSGGDGREATRSIVVLPWAVAADGRADLFIADPAEYRIRRVDSASGIITTAAGDGNPGFSGDGGPAGSASLYPKGVAVDSSGNLFIADTDNNRIRRVDAATGDISTVAGNGTYGYSGDGGLATDADLDYPYGVAVDSSGNLFIADSDNDRIRRVDAVTGIITTVAGDGNWGFSGDGGPATSASLNWPLGVALDTHGNLFIADTGNNRIRRVDAITGIITTVAGDSIEGFSGDGGPATSASLNAPYGVALDAFGNLFIADSSNCRVRRVDAVTGIITTVAGNGNWGFSGDGGPATSASLSGPFGVTVDALGNLFMADYYNNRVRKVALPPFAALTTYKLIFPIQAVGTRSKPQVITLTNTGIWTLSISGLAISGADPGDFAISPPGIAAGGGDAGSACGPSVEPGAHCQISVIFTPKGAGMRTATLTITDDAPDSPQEVALSGTGCVGACSFEPQ